MCSFPCCVFVSVSVSVRVLWCGCERAVGVSKCVLRVLGGRWVSSGWGGGCVYLIFLSVYLSSISLSIQKKMVGWMGWRWEVDEGIRTHPYVHLHHQRLQSQTTSPAPSPAAANYIYSSVYASNCVYTNSLAAAWYW